GGLGLGRLVRAEAGEVVRERYELGALADGTGIPGFYQRLGWETWQGPTWVAGPGGLERTADEDGGILVLRTAASEDLDLRGPLVCDWREGDVW
ncbi:MAG TPA: aminoglycoside 2'-N-acetyltransferase, partial [Actinomycetes bacterium]|nr:aminoglycoside 2'-N-acetyltransferase [Actinomycetes bacterium]